MLPVFHSVASDVFESARRTRTTSPCGPLARPRRGRFPERSVSEVGKGESLMRFKTTDLMVTVLPRLEVEQEIGKSLSIPHEDLPTSDVQLSRLFAPGHLSWVFGKSHLPVFVLPVVLRLLGLPYYGCSVAISNPTGCGTAARHSRVSTASATRAGRAARRVTRHTWPASAAHAIRSSSSTSRIL